VDEAFSMPLGEHIIKGTPDKHLIHSTNRATFEGVDSRLLPEERLACVKRDIRGRSDMLVIAPRVELVLCRVTNSKVKPTKALRVNKPPTQKSRSRSR
jgi:hypothetical protein